MRRAVSLLLALNFVILGCMESKQESTPAGSQKLNFVFILADDLGVKDICVEGSTFYETPHIDAIAKSGLRFSSGYSTCQVCSPSRASILTGKFPARHGVTDFIGASVGLEWKRNGKILPSDYLRALPAEEETLAETMRAAGYKTFFAGKWHLGDKNSFPEDHGFTINKGGFHVGTPKGGYFSPYRNPKLKDGPKGESLPIRLAEETAQFIEDNKDQQFFAYLSFYSVHSPAQTSKELWSKYRKKAHASELAKERFKFDRTQVVRQVQDSPVYGGMMEKMDDAVGIVLKRLKKLGLDKNTVVIFTGDNGGVSSGDAFTTACLPLRGGKGRQWEGGFRVPFYVHVPGMAKGVSTSVPATGADFYPTILELAGLPLKPKQHVDGVSLKPLLAGKQIKKRDLYWHYPHYGNQGGEPSAVIRSGDWKLIYYYEDDRQELYNIKQDVGEANNVAAANSAKVKKLNKKLQIWLKETGAKIPKKDKRFDAEKKIRQLKFQEVFKKAKLEKFHSNILKADWTPGKKGKNWWGSKLTKD